jgi:hypothetical protein
MTEGRTGVVLGIILIALGAIFLAGRALGVDVGAAGWPLFIIVPGVLVFFWGVSMAGREGVGVAIGGAITSVVGAILAFQNATGLWATWAYAWALVGPGGTGLGMLGYGLAHRDATLITGGSRSLLSGIGLFLAFGLFFEGVIGLSGAPFLSTDLGPVVLIAIGVTVLAFGFLRGRSPTA